MVKNKYLTALLIGAGLWLVMFIILLSQMPRAKPLAEANTQITAPAATITSEIPDYLPQHYRLHNTELNLYKDADILRYGRDNPMGDTNWYTEYEKKEEQKKLQEKVAVEQQENQTQTSDKANIKKE